MVFGILLGPEASMSHNSLLEETPRGKQTRRGGGILKITSSNEGGTSAGRNCSEKDNRGNVKRGLSKRGLGPTCVLPSEHLLERTFLKKQSREPF